MRQLILPDVYYDPLDQPYLHREFAGVRTMADCLEFANNYGRLGYYVLAMKEDGAADEAEPLALWLHEAAKMRFAIRLLDLLAKDSTESDQEILGLLPRVNEGALQRISATNDLTQGLAHPLTFMMHALRVPFWDVDGHATYPHPDPDPRDVATWSLNELINEELGRGISTAVWPGQTVFFHVVNNLLGAMYVHLCYELMGTIRPPRLCINCGTFIDDRARSDAKFCGPGCRRNYHYQTKAHRKTKS